MKQLLRNVTQLDHNLQDILECDYASELSLSWVVDERVALRLLNDLRLDHLT